MASLPVTTGDQAEIQASRFSVLKDFAGRLKENAAATFSEVSALALARISPPLLVVLAVLNLWLIPTKLECGWMRAGQAHGRGF
jgi:hypothetical protein